MVKKNLLKNDLEAAFTFVMELSQLFHVINNQGKQVEMCVQKLKEVLMKYISYQCTRLANLGNVWESAESFLVIFSICQ